MYQGKQCPGVKQAARDRDARFESARNSQNNAMPIQGLTNVTTNLHARIVINGKLIIQQQE